MKVVRRLPWLVLVCLAGCEPELVLIDVTGTVYECGDPDDCGTVPEAKVELFDYNTGVETPFIETTTDGSGDFELTEIPGNSVVYMIAHKWEDDRIPTSFVGVTGSQDGELPAGSLYAVSLDAALGLIDDYAAAHPDGAEVQTLDPETPSDGGMVRGRFLTAVEGADPSTWPGTRGLSCYFEDAFGVLSSCVYLDHNGDPDWAATTSTTDGGFAAFGLRAGEVTGVVLDAAFGEAENYVAFTVLSVEDGIVALDSFTSPF